MNILNSTLSRFRFLFLLLFLLTTGASAEDESTRVLFIGNSYTAQIRGVLQEFVAASPLAGKVEMQFISPGGKTLKFHSEQAGTRERIQKGNWKYVVLQDQSQTPAVFPDTFFDGAEALSELIEDSGAQPVFYQTWGRRDGDKMNAHLFPDYESMQKALSKNYSKAARKNDGLLAPVGDVWSEVREANEELGKQLYKGDGSHPSKKGAFLAANVFYKVLFDQDPTEVPYTAGLTPEEVATIHEALKEVLR